jgi:hypothetical protein
MKKLLSILIVLLAFNACKDDCPVELNPCSEFPEEMEIRIHVINPKKVEEVILSPDSIFLAPNLLFFSTNFEYDSIRWQVGSDPSRFIGDNYSLKFEEVSINSSVSVNAIGYRKINTDCFGINDTGKDTISRVITFRDRIESPLFGTWRGTNDGETDSFDVEIQRLYWTNSQGQPIFDGARMTGLPKGTQTREDRENLINGWYHCYIISRDTNELDIGSVEGRIQPNGTLKIQWKLRNSSDRLRTFTAIKIKE